MVRPRAYRVGVPSLLHEGLIALVRNRPDFVAELLAEVLQVEVPPFTEARLAETNLHELVPVEYHADAVVLFVAVRPVFGVIVEPQLQPDERKRFTWPLYAVAARARYECPFMVLVVTPDRATARWAGRPYELGGGMWFQPHVIGPEGIPVVTEMDRAIREPQLAVLSVIAHGYGEPATAAAIASAALAGILQLPEEQRLIYSLLVDSALSEAARKVFEMLPQTKDYMDLLSDTQRRLFADGEAKGKAEGEARSILRILDRRAISVAESQRQRILTCLDFEMLGRWLDLALVVAATDDLFAASAGEKPEPGGR